MAGRDTHLIFQLDPLSPVAPSRPCENRGAASGARAARAAPPSAMEAVNDGEESPLTLVASWLDKWSIYQTLIRLPDSYQHRRNGYSTVLLLLAEKSLEAILALRSLLVGKRGFFPAAMDCALELSPCGNMMTTIITMFAEFLSFQQLVYPHPSTYKYFARSLKQVEQKYHIKC